MKYQQQNSEYLKLNPTWHEEDAVWKAKQILYAIAKNKISATKVAEIGCGSGEVLSQLQKKIDDKSIVFLGFDIAPDAILKAMPKENQQLHFFKKDAKDVEGNFDILLMIDVVEHISDYLDFINTVKSKATYKIFHFPLDMSALSIISNYPIKARVTVGHLHYFMKDTVMAMLKEQGYEVIDWYYTKTAFERNNKNLDFKGCIIQFFRKMVFKVKPDLAVKLFGGFSLLVVTK